MLLVGRARECDAGRTDGRRRTPGENRANPGFASLVLGPELSNLSNRAKLIFRCGIFLSGFRPKYLPGIGGYHVT